MMVYKTTLFRLLYVDAYNHTLLFDLQNRSRSVQGHVRTLQNMETDSLEAWKWLTHPHAEMPESRNVHINTVFHVQDNGIRYYRSL
jgi:hypothetical protein